MRTFIGIDISLNFWFDQYLISERMRLAHDQTKKKNSCMSIHAKRIYLSLSLETFLQVKYKFSKRENKLVIWDWHIIISDRRKMIHSHYSLDVKINVISVRNNSVSFEDVSWVWILYSIVHAVFLLENQSRDTWSVMWPKDIRDTLTESIGHNWNMWYVVFEVCNTMTSFFPI